MTHTFLNQHISFFQMYHTFWYVFHNIYRCIYRFANFLVQKTSEGFRWLQMGSAKLRWLQLASNDCRCCDLLVCLGQFQSVFAFSNCFLWLIYVFDVVFSFNNWHVQVGRALKRPVVGNSMNLNAPRALPFRICMVYVIAGIVRQDSAPVYCIRSTQAAEPCRFFFCPV